ncbi:amino acid ABC transporter permease [Falsarthrobacter nasiphocae]|uniref:amino acid ABC transporter permease n=1 Tax=Falsarthrobacter nasiphocae TaxID=189863 RepID=UPI00286AB1E9|nr:amino acid ABC transporter permease [Falsarthrobacter nasiphocae]
MRTLTDNLDVFGQGLANTVIMFVAAGALSLVLGTLVAGLRVSPVPIMRTLGTLYVTLIRNTPLTLVFFFFAFGLPKLAPSGAPAPSYLALAIGALTVYTATYVCEAIRAGINTVPLGQAEAARAIGLTFMDTLRLVILPQALRSVIPPLMSVEIALLKNTTIAAGFSVLDLGAVRAYLSERGEDAIYTLLWVAIIFIALVAILTSLQHAAEKKWRVAR